MHSVKRAVNRFRSKAGESIAETLIALLIASLALVMLASMIQSASNMITTSKAKMNDYYEANAELENPGTENSLNVAIADASSPSRFTISESYSVNYQENTTFSQKPVLAYTYSPS